MALAWLYSCKISTGAESASSDSPRRPWRLAREGARGNLTGPRARRGHMVWSPLSYTPGLRRSLSDFSALRSRHSSLAGGAWA